MKLSTPHKANWRIETPLCENFALWLSKLTCTLHWIFSAFIFSGWKWKNQQHFSKISSDIHLFFILFGIFVPTPLFVLWIDAFLFFLKVGYASRSGVVNGILLVCSQSDLVIEWCHCRQQSPSSQWNFSWLAWLFMSFCVQALLS